MVSRLGRCSKVPILDADSPSELCRLTFQNGRSLSISSKRSIRRSKHGQFPSTVLTGTPVLGFMAETDLDNLQVVGFKHFNPMWSFPSTSAAQNWDPIAHSECQLGISKMIQYMSKRCSSVAESNCSLQSVNSAPVLGYHCQQDCPSKFRRQRWQEESHILSIDMEWCIYI